jgi:small subunit ribosomal protein S5
MPKSKSTVKILKKDADKKVERTKKDSRNAVDRKAEMMKRIEYSERKGRSRRRKLRKKTEDEFEVRLVSIRRVSKVKAGGKRLRMSVMVVIGDKKGRVAVAISKGRDVKDAENKAINKAKKDLVIISLKGQTIPHDVTYKYKAAKVFLRPAAPGTGVIAGGAVRAVCEVSGIKDILTKVIGSKNIITNVYATFEALKSLKLERFPDDNVT